MKAAMDESYQGKEDKEIKSKTPRQNQINLLVHVFGSTDYRKTYR